MPEQNRLLSIDALRGLTIVSMIIVNTPGSWSHVYSPLLHADWHGLTPTDLVFPFFLLLVGVSTALAGAKQKKTGANLAAVRTRFLIRALKIFAVGVFLNLWPFFDFEAIRWAGVLQRIGLVFAVVSILYLHLRRRTLAVVAIFILLGYWALLGLVPVGRDAVIDEAVATGSIERAHGTRVAVTPVVLSDGAIAANYQPGINLAARFDRQWLPGSMYERTWDPEGWLSTLPSIATALLGALIGSILVAAPVTPRLAWKIGCAGGACLVVGYVWGYVFPLNKNLWTSSFVLVSAGWALVLLTLAIWWIDLQGRRWSAIPFLAFGSNAITAYVLASTLNAFTHQIPIGGNLVIEQAMSAAVNAGIAPKLASLLCALTYTSLVFIPVYFLYKRKIFIRL